MRDLHGTVSLSQLDPEAGWVERRVMLEPRGLQLGDRPALQEEEPEEEMWDAEGWQVRALEGGRRQRSRRDCHEERRSSVLRSVKRAAPAAAAARGAHAACSKCKFGNA